jgi:hypothetical protein
VIDYSVAEELAEVVRALAIAESGENPHQVGDGGRAYGLLQMHPATFKRYYGTYPQGRFAPAVSDTWAAAEIKACAAFLEWHGYDADGQEQKDLIIQAWNLGEAAVFLEHRRNAMYLRRFLAALERVRGVNAK